MDVALKTLLNDVDVSEVAAVQIGKDVDDEAGEENTEVEFAHESGFFLLGPVVGGGTARLDGILSATWRELEFDCGLVAMAECLWHTVNTVLLLWGQDIAQRPAANVNTISLGEVSILVEAAKHLGQCVGWDCRMLSLSLFLSQPADLLSLS